MKTVSKVVAMLLVIICTGLGAVAQDKLRRIEQPAKFVYSNTPIQVEVKLDGKQIPDREIQAGPDWLRKISLEVTNTSDKDINWALINLVLKEPVYGAMIATPETAGIMVTFDLRFSEPTIKVLPSGKTVTLKPPLTMVDYWTKYAQDQGIEDIEKVILDIKQIGFTDGTVWTRGRLSRKDPESGSMVPITTNSKPPELYLPSSFLIPQLFFF